MISSKLFKDASGLVSNFGATSIAAAKYKTSMLGETHSYLPKQNQLSNGQQPHPIKLCLYNTIPENPIYPPNSSASVGRISWGTHLSTLSNKEYEFRMQMELLFGSNTLETMVTLQKLTPLDATIIGRQYLKRMELLSTLLRLLQRICSIQNLNL